MQVQRRNGNENEKGAYVVAMAVSAIALMGLAGFGIDLINAYIAKSVLRTAIDAAVLGAARVGSADRASMSDTLFSANFPATYMNASSVSHTPLSVTGNKLSMSGSATTPGYFIRAVGLNALTVNAYAEAEVFSPPQLIVLDEDAIDNGTPQIETLSGSPTLCGNGDAAMCVNDDIAAFSLRTHLFSRGKEIRPYSGLVLPSGQTGDWGWFRFQKADPQVSRQNNAQFTTQEFINATGAASNENNLDKVTDVVPLAAADLNALAGKNVCAVVFDSDVSVDVSDHYGVLKGSTMGVTAFTVVSTTAQSGSYLPYVTVNLLSASDVTSVCSAAVSGSNGNGTPRITLKR